jgi:hypothetical protein
MADTALSESEAASLIRAKKTSNKAFTTKVNATRKRGFTDAEIVKAMVQSAAMVDAVGGALLRARRSKAAAK